MGQQILASETGVIISYRELLASAHTGAEWSRLHLCWLCRDRLVRAGGRVSPKPWLGGSQRLRPQAEHRNHFLQAPDCFPSPSFSFSSWAPASPCVKNGVNCMVSFWGLSWRRTRMMDLLQFDRLLQTEAHFLPEAHGRAQEDDHLLLKLEDMCLQLVEMVPSPDPH